jgi:hypothetical protein
MVCIDFRRGIRFITEKSFTGGVESVGQERLELTPRRTIAEVQTTTEIVNPSSAAIVFAWQDIYLARNVKVVLLPPIRGSMKIHQIGIEAWREFRYIEFEPIRATFHPEVVLDKNLAGGIIRDREIDRWSPFRFPSDLWPRLAEIP